MIKLVSRYAVAALRMNFFQLSFNVAKITNASNPADWDLTRTLINKK